MVYVVVEKYPYKVTSPLIWNRVTSSYSFAVRSVAILDKDFSLHPGRTNSNFPQMKFLSL
jgi:hypothetical protein